MKEGSNHIKVVIKVLQMMEVESRRQRKQDVGSIKQSRRRARQDDYSCSSASSSSDSSAEDDGCKKGNCRKGGDKEHVSKSKSKCST